jgi:hypothetical protein
MACLQRYDHSLVLEAARDRDTLLRRRQANTVLATAQNGRRAGLSIFTSPAPERRNTDLSEPYVSLSLGAWPLRRERRECTSRTLDWLLSHLDHDCRKQVNAF